MVKTIQAMKKIDEIKTRRQQRFFERRMAKAKAKKRTDIENELLRHADLISDTKVKAFIMKKREKQLELRQEKYAKEAKYSAMRKDMEMLVEESEEDEDIKALAKVKKTKAIKKK